MQYLYIMLGDIDKETFIYINEALTINDLKLTEEEIDILFCGNENEIKQKLKAENTYYYNGMLYSLRMLSTPYYTDSSLLQEMAQKGALGEYLDHMEELAPQAPSWEVSPEEHIRQIEVIRARLDRVEPTP